MVIEVEKDGVQKAKGGRLVITLGPLLRVYASWKSNAVFGKVQTLLPRKLVCNQILTNSRSVPKPSSILEKSGSVRIAASEWYVFKGVNKTVIPSTVASNVSSTLQIMS